MAKNLLILSLISLLTATFLLPPASCFLPAFSDQSLPLWWEIEILLTSDGDYKVEGGKSSYSGHYSFTILWTGSMVRDEEDFILYYEKSELISFEGEEKGIFPESIRIISSEDFLDKPSLNLNYILRKDENLHFDFIAEGFPAPQNKSEYKFYLNLPASEENSLHSSELDYNSFVSKGSNRIFLKEKEIYSAAVKKKFAWEWKYKKWHTIRNKPICFSNSHKAKVELSLTPHYKRTSI